MVQRLKLVAVGISIGRNARCDGSNNSVSYLREHFMVEEILSLQKVVKNPIGTKLEQ